MLTREADAMGIKQIWWKAYAVSPCTSHMVKQMRRPVLRPTPVNPNVCQAWC